MMLIRGLIGRGCCICIWMGWSRGLWWICILDKGYIQCEKRFKKYKCIVWSSRNDLCPVVSYTITMVSGIVIVWRNFWPNHSARQKTFSCNAKQSILTLLAKTAESNQSQSGLELDALDYCNGTERSVGTLSGGESFKALLSLALGLSDEIQSSAGGIRLDTMFVDEGFGSLDEESLRQAIQTLNALSKSNRLVGIISHVAELMNKIDKQIVVTKEKSGGSKIEIVV